METALGTDRLGVLLAELDLCDLPPLPGPSRLDLGDQAERPDGDREVGKALAERGDDWRGRADATAIGNRECVHGSASWCPSAPPTMVAIRATESTGARAANGSKGSTTACGAR